MCVVVGGGGGVVALFTKSYEQTLCDRVYCRFSLFLKDPYFSLDI